jgi:hypothetical protein
MTDRSALAFAPVVAAVFHAAVRRFLRAVNPEEAQTPARITPDYGRPTSLASRAEWKVVWHDRNVKPERNYDLI